MTEEYINIIVNNEVMSIVPKTTVGEALHADRNPDIIGGLISNDVVGLNTPLNVPVNLYPVFRNSREGRQIFNRTCSLLLDYILAVHFKKYHFQVGQAFNQGCYYELVSIEDESTDQINLVKLAEDIDKAICEAIASDLKFTTKVHSVETACVLLNDRSGSMIRLLETWPYSQVPIASLNHFHVIQYGPIAPSTRYCRNIRILPYERGIFLQFNRKQPTPVPKSNLRLFSAYKENRNWNKMIGVATVGDLNEAVLNGRISDIIRLQEGLHEKKIIQIADQIANHKDKLRLICIAGPSSSGKTTFLKRLSVQLRVAGLDPVTISLDDYYRDISDRPVDAQGNIDFEALECLDIPLLTEHLQTLADGGKVMTPRYDFEAGKRAPASKFTPMQLKSNQILLIEGIHGLNPAIADAVPAKARFRIFVSALTQLIIDEHTRIPTSDARLLRRIVRDRRYRGTSAADTIDRWPSVRRGEQRNIFPFQENCDVMFNSALVYETAILKTFAWRYLLEVPRNSPARVRAQPLLRFLDLFVPIFPDDIPSNSLLREFIGGSNFSY
ncbi:MAG: uridine kinase [Candidatus Bruticola sp.]